MSHAFHPTDYTVDEIEARLEDVTDVDDAEAILELEQAGNARTTAVEAIEDRLDELAPDEEPDGATDRDGTERITIRNHRHESVEVAGHHFDAGEVKRVRNTQQVQLALKRGNIQFVTSR